MGTRVLIVEDEIIIAQDLAQSLADEGFVVTEIVTNVADALASVERQRPDVVLMDVQLAGPGDGIEAARALAERGTAPVVFLTANTDALTVRRALDTLAFSFVAKPFNLPSLVATLTMAVHGCKRDSARTAAHHAERDQLLQRNAELSHLTEQLRAEATQDSLTGLFNRRYLDEVLAREIGLATRRGHAVGVILLDLDRFKLINDTYGHIAADSALRKVADYIRSRLRVYDVACRYGGEEIVIVAPGARLCDASQLAEQLRTGIERLTVEHEGRALSRITASFGVAAFPRHGVEVTDLLTAADAALYTSKTDGRNRVSLAPVH